MMSESAATQFAQFFQAVHGYEPFDWQKALAREVLETGGWPDVISVPTACGKTSMLDLALFELSLQARREPKQRSAARRICFVVDRRLVVDEAAEHARLLQRAIRSAVKGDRVEPALKAVAERLSSLAADPAEPLLVARLRGGVYRDDGWTNDPLTPSILISTVDQTGSRLLFRGYGVSPRARPVHAALLAFDTRIILDEAHLSTVFADTIAHIRRYQQRAKQSPLPESRHISIVRMSATAGDPTQHAFGLTDDMRNDKRLAPRLQATKQTQLIEVEVKPITKKDHPRKARELRQKNREILVSRLVAEAKKWLNSDEALITSPDSLPKVIGIVVNRVATARLVFDQLRKGVKGDPQYKTILLTGRIRPYDRDRLLKEWLPQIKAGREKSPDKPLFVVATQTVEVGANLDFDALVTEAAPLDCLRQRFGRLDRLGRRYEQNLPSPACAIIQSDQVFTEKQLRKLDEGEPQDPIYGNAIAHTWNWLKENAITEASGKKKSMWIDFGVNQLDTKLSRDHEELQRMLAPKQVAPLLFPAHLDAWVQTNPLPAPDPDIAPFLHGQADSTADVLVIWRADLNEGNHQVWNSIASLMPPLIREALPIPIYEFRAWLRNQASSEVADVEGAGLNIEGDRKDNVRRVLRWRGAKDAKVLGPDDVLDIEAIKPGDTIIVPAEYGGADEFGWNPASNTPVADVAEACLAQLIASYPANAFRRPRLRFRLSDSLFDAFVTDQPIKKKLKQLLHGILTVSEVEKTSLLSSIKNLLSILLKLVAQPALEAAIGALLRAPNQPQINFYPQMDGLVIAAAAPVLLSEELAAPPEDLEQEDPSSNATSFMPDRREVLLEDHSLHTEEMAANFAYHCGLDEEFQDALSLASQWHDEGKCDRRFQAWLRGSELKALAALSAGHVLAKSARSGQDGSRYGYSRGLRHEFVSVRLFEEAYSGNDGKSIYELAKLLIGTHHGFGRPFAPVVPESEELHPIQVARSHDGMQITVSSDHRLYRLDSGWTDLFWHMIRHYGWWGLAYLEAMLITADHVASAKEQLTVLK